MQALKAPIVAVLLWLPSIAAAVEFTLAFGPPTSVLIRPPPIQLTPIVSGLSSPTFVTHAGTGPTDSSSSNSQAS